MIIEFTFIYSQLSNTFEQFESPNECEGKADHFQRHGS